MMKNNFNLVLRSKMFRESYKFIHNDLYTADLMGIKIVETLVCIKNDVQFDIKEKSLLEPIKT